METWTPPAYRYSEGQAVEAQGDQDWTRVEIVYRTLVFDIDGRRVPVYMVEDNRGTRWCAGEGELRPEL